MKGNKKRFVTFILMLAMALATVSAKETRKETRKEREDRIYFENQAAAQKAYAESASKLLEELYNDFMKSRDRYIKAEESLKEFEAEIEEDPELMSIIYGGEETLREELKVRKEWVERLLRDAYANYMVLTNYMDQIEREKSK